MRIRFVPKHVVNFHWSAAAPLLLQAIQASAGETNLEAVKGRIEDGTMLLFLGYPDDGPVAAAFAVSLVYYDNFSALRVVLAAGEPMSKWVEPLIAVLEDACDTMGCQQVELFGRAGFARALADRADHQYTVMVRKVPHVGRKRANDRI